MRKVNCEGGLFVTRYDFNRTHGWIVRVRGLASKLFSDGTYGSKQVALREAQKFRDAHQPRRRKPHPHKAGSGRIYRETRSYRHHVTGEAIRYEAWSAWIRVRGKPRHTSYSITKHGQTAAKLMALAWLHARSAERK